MARAAVLTALVAVVFIVTGARAVVDDAPIACDGNTMNVVAAGTTVFVESPDAGDEDARYPNDWECSLLLTPQPGHVLHLEFVHFDVESHPQCRWDAVSIEANGESLKACGRAAPAPIESAAAIILAFSSDDSVAKGGFVAVVTSCPAGEYWLDGDDASASACVACASAGDFECGEGTYAAQCGPTTDTGCHACHESCLSCDGPGASDCSETAEGQHECALGFFDTAAAGDDYVWNDDVDEDEQGNYNNYGGDDGWDDSGYGDEDADEEYNSGDGDWGDWDESGDGEWEDGSGAYGSLGGSNYGSLYGSGDGSSYGDNCDDEVHVPAGSSYLFASGRYDNDLNCIHLYTTDEGAKLSVRWHSFSVEYEERCGYDWVKVVDDADSLMGADKLCGCSWSLPEPFNAAGNALVAKFHTDGSVRREGFVAEVISCPVGQFHDGIQCQTCTAVDRASCEASGLHFRECTPAHDAECLNAPNAPRETDKCWKFDSDGSNYGSLGGSNYDGSLGGSNYDGSLGDFDGPDRVDEEYGEYGSLYGSGADDSCDDDVHVPAGGSYLFASGFYDNDLNCVHQYTTGEGAKLSVRWHSFSVEFEERCGYDWVKVVDDA
eukprot:CAMPEP_0203806936 /NCGR_PEP_ID=MMETSP0115-20131106/786_1 /ASSEMBLY_ACC=CAM_ASM_000227 /TAXON_ID=33651 /ORGANISM="Bicosoecid sp, Strain ms1" /LENGTH=605 /DNA_ID=CAMNT_0050715603 /DNA_START=66 /DNA_END=1879 /DNA_ORIENTATION=+